MTRSEKRENHWNRLGATMRIAASDLLLKRADMPHRGSAYVYILDKMTDAEYEALITMARLCQLVGV